MNSRLLLKSYTFRRIEVIASDSPLDETQCHVETKRTFWNAEGKSRDWKILLEIDFGKDDKKPISYTGSVAVEGFVEVDAEYPEKMVSQLVSITGSSLLFGAAREMIAILTARGPHKPLLLPSISFYDMDKEAAAQKEKAASTDAPTSP
jgi:preprotein translocase subunit SecB